MSELNKVLEKIWGEQLSKDIEKFNSMAATANSGGTITVSRNITDITKVLGDDEHHDRIFWKYLVDVGWKKNIIDANGWAGAVQIVLLHDKCGKVLESRQLNGLSEEQAEIYGSTGYVTGLIATHKARGKCKALEEDESED